MSADDMPVPMMSTGQPSTLGNWYAMCVATFGEESAASQFIKAKMDSQGENMAVIADEGQLLYSLMVMNFNQQEGQGDIPTT
jgi:hypothetical protein